MLCRAVRHAFSTPLWLTVWEDTGFATRRVGGGCVPADREGHSAVRFPCHPLLGQFVGVASGHQTRVLLWLGLSSGLGWQSRGAFRRAGEHLAVRVPGGTLPGLERFCSVLLGRVCGTPGALTAQRRGRPAFSEPVRRAGTSAWPASDLSGITGHRVTSALRHILGTTST